MSSSLDPLTGTTLSPMNVSYTALVATLVLLLAVSSAIVIRSLVLRRRHQRLVEEAIRTGTWLPNHLDPTSGRRRRDIGQKPKLWEAWLHQHDDDDDDACEKDTHHWVDITPVSVAYTHPPTSALSRQASVVPPEHAPRPSRILRPFTRRPPPSAPPPTASMAGQAPLAAASPSPSPTPTVLVGVLIAMPSASPRHAGDEHEPPVVEIGVSQVHVREDAVETPGRS